MSTVASPHHETLELVDEHAAFLSGPPRSGELSPFAQKLAAQCFVWLASIIVFGSTADFAAQEGTKCTPLCKFAIATGVLSFFGYTLILVGHYLTWSSKLDKGTWFSSAAEKRYMIILCIWWIFGVACLSAYENVDPSAVPTVRTEYIVLLTMQLHTTRLALIFGWLAFFGTIFGTYKAYHSQKEEMKSLRYAQILSLQATEEEEYANFS